MTLADDIMNELRKRSGLTAMEIAVSIFGRRQYYKPVYQECRRLVEAGRLLRRGEGGQDDPFTYYLPPST
jgi:hypothetical protein